MTNAVPAIVPSTYHNGAVALNLERIYWLHVDGKQRDDGMAVFLASHEGDIADGELA